MMCDQPKVQLYLYLDGELASSEAAEVEQHLQSCEECEAEATAHHRLQGLLQVALPEEEVPEQLWASIEQRLPAPEPVAEPVVLARPPFKRVWGKVAWGSGVAVAALLLLGFLFKVGFSPSVPIIVQELVDSQIRAQLMHAPYEKVAAEAGAIRRWFDGQVEFAPPLPAIPSDAYTLQGVRLNYFLNRRVAEIAYASEQHVLSFLMFTHKEISLASMHPVRMGNRTFYAQSYKGYNTVLWQDGEIMCSLVSDLQLPDLLRVAREATSI